MIDGILLGVVSGVFLALQGGCTARMAISGGRGWACFITVCISCVAGLILFLVLTNGARQGFDLAQGYRDAPWYSYIGGFLGALYVILVVTFISRLGAARFFLVCVLFQLVVAFILDSFAVAGLSKRSPSLGRISGIILMFLGAILINLPAKWDRPLWRNQRCRESASAATDTAVTTSTTTTTSETVIIDSARQSSSNSSHDSMMDNYLTSTKSESGVSRDDLMVFPQDIDGVKIEEELGIGGVGGVGGGSGGGGVYEGLISGCKEWLLLLAPAVGGSALALQAAFNTSLSKSGYGRSLATLYSLISALFVLFFLFLYEHLYVQATDFKKVYRETPWWSYTAGFLGFTYVMTITLYSSVVGATNLLATVIAAQILTAVVIDQFALVGFPKRIITVGRASGVAVLLAGLSLLPLF